MGSQSAEELISKFESDLRNSAKKSSAKYFLMSVESVKEASGKINQLLVTGVRTDTRQRVAVVTSKPDNGQYLPEVGGMMRADKVTSLQSADLGVPRYSAQYFHAYGQSDRCLHAVVQCRPPYQDGDGKWNANVLVLDHEGPSVHIKTVEEFDKFALALIRPWAWKNPGKCTHDVMGNPLWNTEGARGISPVVHIKIMGGEKVLAQIYGRACVSQSDGTTRLPSPSESKALLEQSAGFQKVRALFDHEAVQTLGMVLVPGISIGVGRASIANGQERYLRYPEGWDWSHEAEGDAQPQISRGFRSGMIHIKQSPTGQWGVVDANPSAENRISPWGPKSTVEIEFERESPLSKQAKSQEQAIQRSPAADRIPAQEKTTSDNLIDSQVDVAEPSSLAGGLGEDLIHTGEATTPAPREPEASPTNSLDDIFADAEKLAQKRRGMPQFRM